MPKAWKVLAISSLSLVPLSIAVGVWTDGSPQYWRSVTQHALFGAAGIFGGHGGNTLTLAGLRVHPTMRAAAMERAAELFDQARNRTAAVTAWIAVTRYYQQSDLPSARAAAERAANSNPTDSTGVIARIELASDDQDRAHWVGRLATIAPHHEIVLTEACANELVSFERGVPASCRNTASLDSTATTYAKKDAQLAYDITHFREVSSDSVGKYNRKQQGLQQALEDNEAALRELDYIDSGLTFEAARKYLERIRPQAARGQSLVLLAIREFIINIIAPILSRAVSFVISAWSILAIRFKHAQVSQEVRGIAAAIQETETDMRYWSSSGALEDMITHRTALSQKFKAEIRSSAARTYASSNVSLTGAVTKILGESR